MKKSVLGIITLSTIFLIVILYSLIFGNVQPLFDIVWTFPGNFDFFKSFPSEEMPLGVVPLMIIALIGTGIFISFKLSFPQVTHFWHGVKVTMGIYDDPDDEGDLNHFKALSTDRQQLVSVILPVLLPLFITADREHYSGCG